MHRKKAQSNSEDEFVYSPWLAQITNIIKSKDLFAVLGRGSTKSTEFAVERFMDICFEMPGSPICWMTDTYTNLKQNVLPAILEGLNRKGWREGEHYIIEKKPQIYTDKQKESLPEWLKPTFWKPVNFFPSYKNRIVTYTGTTLTFISMDRPSSGAGASYVHCFGDEAKYLPERKVANVLKAVRGYNTLFGGSPYYLGSTFLTDMPNTQNIGEHDWILKNFAKMDIPFILQMLKCGLILNQIKHELVSALQSKDYQKAVKLNKVRQRWSDRMLRIRHAKQGENLSLLASSFINIDILTLKWFEKSIDMDMGDFKTAILSLPPSLEQGKMFYHKLTDNNFFYDGTQEYWTDKFGLSEADDCRVLKYLDLDAPLDGGIDFGNMNSFILAQNKLSDYRLIKDFYVLSPQSLTELGAEFVRFFEPHKHKILNLFYDRAGNNYNVMNEDLATKIKKAIEFNADGQWTKWHVILQSKKQGNIPQSEEYWFMTLALEGSVQGIPKIKIDYYNCKHARLSLEQAKVNVNSKRGLFKDKRSEKLPLHRLPKESTNFSDAFKYLLMRKGWRELYKINQQKRSE